MHWAINRLCVMLAATVLDFIIGDPQNPFHPIRLVGNAVGFGVKLYRRLQPTGKVTQFVAGMVLSISVVVTFFALTWLLISVCYQINLWLGIGMEAVVCYFLLAAKSLKTESMKVYRSVVEGNIEAARFNLSMIVSRDTNNLTEPDIVKGAVETVAENFSDGVIAPLFYIAIGGAPLGMAYKAANTLDSMIGYKTEEFFYFGKFAARFDDVVNFIPSRLSALMLIVGSVFVGADTGQAARIFRRDNRNHSSPNSAQTMSACAGALGLKLGGDTWYHGELVHKPTIGDEVNQLVPQQIVLANRLMYSATLCAVVLFVACITGAAVLGEIWGLRGLWEIRVFPGAARIRESHLFARIRGAR